MELVEMKPVCVKGAVCLESGSDLGLWYKVLEVDLGINGLSSKGSVHTLLVKTEPKFESFNPE